MPDPKGAVLLDIEKNLACLTFAGNHGNAINDRLLVGLLAATERVREDGEIRGVLLTSRGSLFCPGLDLQELIEYDRPAMEAFLEKFSRTMMALYTLPRPVVAALDGHAIAGGCVLAMTTDWRVLKRGALIGLNEVKVGVPLPWGVAQILRDAVAGPRLEEICLLGRNYSDGEALATGLAHELAEPGATREAARQRLEEFAEKDTEAFGVTKGYLRHAVVQRILEAEDRRRGEFLERWFSEETRRRILSIVNGLRKR